MAEYAVAPMTEPSWRFDASDFARRLRDEWPDAKIGVNDLPGSPMVVHALISLGDPSRELGVALSDSGQYVSLDPADPETAARFVRWYVNEIPAQGPPIHIFPKEAWRPFEVTTDTSEAEIIDHLSQD